MAVLTVRDDGALDHAVRCMRATLGLWPKELAAFDRIVAGRRHIDRCRTWHQRAVELASAFGMRPVAEPPAAAFSWDGVRVRSMTEPAVLIHEVAHFQLASPQRRGLPDFGLGAGPETGLTAIAERSRLASDVAREEEEQMASLLGILWETELGQPGIHAFVEQNWLEGAGRASTAEFFVAILRRLRSRSLLDDDYGPVYAVSIRAD